MNANKMRFNYRIPGAIDRSGRRQAGHVLVENEAKCEFIDFYYLLFLILVCVKGSKAIHCG